MEHDLRGTLTVMAMLAGSSKLGRERGVWTRCAALPFDSRFTYVQNSTVHCGLGTSRQHATCNMTTASTQVNPQVFSLISARIDSESRLGVLLLFRGGTSSSYKIVYIVPLLPRVSLLSNQAKQHHFTIQISQSTTGKHESRPR